LLLLLLLLPQILAEDLEASLLRTKKSVPGDIIARYESWNSSFGCLGH
jgi:Vps4 C terminal oligomerisation domain